MNQFFLYWVDLVALLLSLGLGAFLAFKVVKKSYLPVRPLAAFFLFFGPVAIAVHMCFHLSEIFYRAGVALAEGTFVYSFRFYSLQMMGVLLTVLSLDLLKKSFAKCRQRHYKNSHLLRTMGMIVLVSAPTIPFTPIGSLPTLACLITLIALLFVHKKKRSVSTRVARFEPLSTLVKQA